MSISSFLGHFFFLENIWIFKLFYQLSLKVKPVLELKLASKFIKCVPYRVNQACRLWGCRGVPWHPQILAEQLTLSQPEGADYAHQIILAPPDFQTFLLESVQDFLIKSGIKPLMHLL